MNNSKLFKDKSGKKESGVAKDRDKEIHEGFSSFEKREISELTNGEDLQKKHSSDGSHSNEVHSDFREKRVESQPFNEKVQELVPSMITTK